MVQSKEEIEQATLFRWASYAQTQYEELKLMYHIPNEGKRSAATGARLKAEGLKAGVPDVCLPTAHGGYIGLYIEMKVKPNKPTELQKQWLRDLRKAGHMTAVCYSWEEAKNLIEEYIRLPLTISKGDKENE